MRRCRWAASLERLFLSLREGRVVVWCCPAQHFLKGAATSLRGLLRALLGKVLGSGVWPSAAIWQKLLGWQSLTSGLARLGFFLFFRLVTDIPLHEVHTAGTCYLAKSAQALLKNQGGLVLRPVQLQKAHAAESAQPRNIQRQAYWAAAAELQSRRDHEATFAVVRPQWRPAPLCS